MTVPDRSERLKWIYSARDSQELAQRYDAWAEEYDRDVLSYGYKIPAVVVGLMGRYMKPEDGTVLDAGAGTGIMGEIMTLLGYRDMVALDISQGMLEVARRKRIYRELCRMALGEPLDFPDNAFAAVVATGVLTVGHAPPHSLDEMVRITRPGGHIIFSVRDDAYLKEGFKEKQDALEREGLWRLVEMTEPFQSLPLGEPEVRNRVFVYRIT